MKIRLALVALSLSLAPAAGFAMCSDEHAKDSAATCAVGQQWDAEKLACVPVASS